jgi:surface protein
VLLACFRTASSLECFAPNGNAVLKAAVSDYIKNGGANSTAGKRYGGTIGSWCVSKVNSFAQVFMGQTTFNSPLTGWKTTNATIFAQFFQGATKFNQPLGHFDTSKVTNFDRVFYGATAFQGLGLNTWNTARASSFYWAFKNSSMNANVSAWTMGSATDLREAFRFTPFKNNLCLWGNTLQKANLPSTRLANMFASTNCPVKTTPSFADSPTGPLCYACPAWRWGKTCFPEDGNALSAAVEVRCVVDQSSTRFGSFDCFASPTASTTPLDVHQHCSEALNER